MKVAIIPIGNSKGIRIPKAILEQCHIKKSADLETKNSRIIISPFKEESRKDWEQVFMKMHKIRDDQLIIDDSIDLDMENWEW